MPMVVGPAFACSWTPLPNFKFGSDHECLGTCLPSLTSSGPPNMRLSQHRKKGPPVLPTAHGNGPSLRLNGRPHSQIRFLRHGMSGTVLLKLTWLKLGFWFRKREKPASVRIPSSSPGEVTKDPTNQLEKDKLVDSIVRWLRPNCSFVKINSLIP